MKIPLSFKRHYVQYTEWEDYKFGMYKKIPKHEELLMIKKSLDFMSSHTVYGEAMGEVIYLWPRTMLHNLTNPSINKLAFLGQCANCYKIKCPEYLTRNAWWNLTSQQRELADDIARKTIIQWQLRRNTKQLNFDFRN